MEKIGVEPRKHPTTWPWLVGLLVVIAIVAAWLGAAARQATERPFRERPAAAPVEEMDPQLHQYARAVPAEPSARRAA